MANIILNLTDISYTYFDKPILAGLSWEIQAGQKIGLVGANGTGKSTLLRLILGQHAPEAGAIFRVRELTIGYLPQEGPHPNPPPLRRGRGIPHPNPPPLRQGRGIPHPNPPPLRQGREPPSPVGTGEGSGMGVSPLPQGREAPPLPCRNGGEGWGEGASATVLDTALSGSPEIARLRAALAEAEARMGDPAVYGDAARLARVLDEHGRLLHAYEAAGGLTYENRVRATLRELGLGDETFDQPVDTLSGGQAKRVGLARLLVWGPDVLLLDEPDNHLDVAGKEVVERLVRGYAGTVIVVSHDRYLLDQVVDRIAELEGGRIMLWPGSYSAYAINKQLARLRQEQLYKAQQKRIGQIEAAIARFELWASIVVDERHARQARARYKMLERMDKIERPGEGRRMRLELGGWRGSNKVLEIGRLVKWYKGERDINVVLDGVDLTIWHGERVGLVGPNGAGKSALFRLLGWHREYWLIQDYKFAKNSSGVIWACFRMPWSVPIATSA